MIKMAGRLTGQFGLQDSVGGGAIPEDLLR